MILMIITCASCKASTPYKVSSYLNELAYQSGINLSQEINDSYNALVNWEVVKENESNLLNDDLTFKYLYTTIGRLINESNSKEYLLNNKWISIKEDNELINEDEAKTVIKKAVQLINNPDIDNDYYYEEKDIDHLKDYYWEEDNLIIEDDYEIGDIVYLEEDNEYKKITGKEGNQYLYEDPEIEEVLNNLYISGSNEIDLNEADIIPYNDEVVKTNYQNTRYDLLAATRHTFNSKGYMIAYSFNSSGIDVRVSKNNKDKANMFFDISLSNIKPTYKWKYNDGNIETSFFKVNYKLTNEIGFSNGKYKNYYLDFKDLDSSSFLSAVKSSIKSKEDEIECTIPICQIKTPIPGVPLANFNIDVVAKIYVTGKVEIALYNTGTIGFESKNNNFRVIHDIESDLDFIVGGSARAVAGINFNIEATNYRLMDIEFDGGSRAAVSTTVHLYDEEGNKTEEEVDIPYSVLDEVAKENSDIRICGDISLNWVFDIQINTSKTILYKYGFTYKKAILDTRDQVFNNLTHIENWQFVKKCTRKNRSTTAKPEESTISSNKIILAKYSAVVIKGETYKIPITSIPSSYSLNDLVYYSNNSSIASVNGGIVEAHDIGSTIIEIKTNDNKYKAYINILVSTG